MDNRRRDFRVDTTVQRLHIEQLSETEYQYQRQQYHKNSIELYRTIELNQRIILSIRTVESRYPELGELLTLLNDKIDHLQASWSAMMSVATQNHAVISVEDDVTAAVNISGSGIALFLEKPYQSGDLLQIDLQTIPQGEKFHLFGKVVYSLKQSDDANYRVGVEWDYVLEADRDRVIHLVMLVQQQQLQHSRHST